MTRTIKKIATMEVEFSAAELSKINSVCNLLVDLKYEMDEQNCLCLENEELDVVTTVDIDQVYNFLTAFSQTKIWKMHLDE